MFLAGLGVVIGNRMSVEAMGVVVGVVLGVAASIPMTLLVMLFLTRKDKKEEDRRNSAAYPPVIVVTGNGQPTPMRMPYMTPPANFGGDGQRAFTLIGDEDSLSATSHTRGSLL
jgi:hypothetical protein